MSVDAAKEIKLRLRADLRAALRDGRGAEVKMIRSLLAAVDNAEAPPLPAGQTAPGEDATNRSAEVKRLRLDEAQVRAALLAEIEEREGAAVELERLERTERAASLRAEAAVGRRYLK